MLHDTGIRTFFPKYQTLCPKTQRRQEVQCFDPILGKDLRKQILGERGVISGLLRSFKRLAELVGSMMEAKITTYWP